MNRDAEKKASEIRLRAEIRAGEMLKAMKQSGARQKQGQASGGNGKGKLPLPPKLSDFGVNKKQSSDWQQLADIPEKEREAAGRVSSSISWEHVPEYLRLPQPSLLPLSVSPRLAGFPPVSTLCSRFSSHDPFFTAFARIMVTNSTSTAPGKSTRADRDGSDSGHLGPRFSTRAPRRSLKRVGSFGPPFRPTLQPHRKQDKYFVFSI